MSDAGVAAVPGAELAWTSDGDGRVIVLVHAGIADARMWDGIVAPLAARYRVIRFDMRGFGGSRSEHGASFTPARDAAELLGELGVGSAHVVGASFGGQVALELVAVDPAAVASLVLLAPSLPDHDWSREVEVYGAAEERAIEEGRLDDADELNLRMWVDGPRRLPGDSDPAIRALVGEMHHAALEIQLREQAEEEDLDPPVSERLAAIDVPVTIAVGDLDVEDFHAIAARLAAQLPQATLVRIPGAGHLLALERPSEVAQLVARHLDDVTAAASPPR